MTALLSVENLSVTFRSNDRFVHAVRSISYTLATGSTLAIVGESGSGKSAHILAMLGLVTGSHIDVSGKMLFRGQDLLAMPQSELRRVRGKDIGIVFQDPMSSLNPVLTIGRQIAEPLMRHLGLRRSVADRRAAELLELVGISEPNRRLKQYPHELSGGMRQRVMIAIAIACEPSLLIADEATTALDVTVQGQIVDLVRDLQKKIGMAIIWVSHDLGVVAGVADNVQVMYAGRILERGPASSIFKDPRNAYTWGLLESLPGRHPQSDRLFQIEGFPPDLSQPLTGDPFAPRNPFATVRCFAEEPTLQPVADGNANHEVAAWYDLRAALKQRGRVTA
jgi:oligopeptide/dipeptide ABC transporter ATP-binding protein